MNKLFFIALVSFFAKQTFADVQIHGTSEGQFVETENTIYVSGNVYQNNGTGQAALTINNPYGKKIIVQNLNIHSHNGMYHSNDKAAIVDIRYGNGHSTLNNIRVTTTGNTKINAIGGVSENSVCAALVCETYGSGNTNNTYGSTYHDGNRQINFDIRGNIETNAVKFQ